MTPEASPELAGSPQTVTGRKVFAIHGSAFLDDVLGIEAEASDAARSSAVVGEGDDHCAGCGNALHHRCEHTEIGCQRCVCSTFVPWPAALVRTPETLDSDAFRDQHERAIRAHILEGPEDHRCDDLCSAAIIDRLVGKHPVNEYPPLASPAPDPGWLDVSERAGVSLWPERIEARQVVTADRDVIVIIGPLPRADALRATPVADTAGMPPEHRPVLGKVPRADLQRIECACGWLWDDRDPLDDPEGMDFMRHLAALAASPAPDPGAGLRATVAELLDVMHGAFSLGTGPCSCEVHVRARAALAPSAEPPETAG